MVGTTFSEPSYLLMEHGASLHKLERDSWPDRGILPKEGITMLGSFSYPITLSGLSLQSESRRGAQADYEWKVSPRYLSGIPSINSVHTSINIMRR